MLPDLTIADVALMSTESRPTEAGRRKAKWIARGFLGAFALSVATVIYTGLSVDGFVSDFDSGFRSLTFRVGETRSVEVHFDSPSRFAEARLTLSLPAAVEPGAPDDAWPDGRPVTLAPGDNVFSVTVRGVQPGSGYLVARVEASEPVGLYRVFLTVTPE